MPESPSDADMAPSLELLEVNNPFDFNKLINLPRYIYRDDRAWVPPLYVERMLHFSRFNPYFEHAEWQAWMVYRDGQPAGRISAQVDRLHRERYGADTGHFGLLDAVDDENVIKTLVTTAEKWLHQRGARQITGPMTFSVNQECGLLVDGFEKPPVVMMPHSSPWLGPALENLGYEKATDLYAYWVDVEFEVPRVMSSLTRRYQDSVQMRTLNRADFKSEMAILMDLFNDAWSENWGFVPFTEAEFKELGNSLRLVVPDEYIHIAEIDSEPVAFIAGLPNLNEIIREFDGKLLPGGWLKLIRGLKPGGVSTGRVPLMGVRKKYQNRPIGMALAFLTIDALRTQLTARGVKEVEMSWILEDNSGMRNILDAIGSDLYKTYRLYQKTLAD